MESSIFSAKWNLSYCNIIESTFWCNFHIFTCYCSAFWILHFIYRFKMLLLVVLCLASHFQSKMDKCSKQQGCSLLSTVNFLKETSKRLMSLFLVMIKMLLKNLNKYVSATFKPNLCCLHHESWLMIGRYMGYFLSYCHLIFMQTTSKWLPRKMST